MHDSNLICGEKLSFVFIESFIEVRNLPVMHKIAILSGLTLPVAKLTKEMIKIIVAE